MDLTEFFGMVAADVLARLAAGIIERLMKMERPAEDGEAGPKQPKQS